MKTTTRPFPKKASEAIRMALADLRAAEESGSLVIDMNDWHRRWMNGYNCSVCFAGSVMAGAFDMDDIDIVMSENMATESSSNPDLIFPYEWTQLFNALDQVRQYKLYNASLFCSLFRVDAIIDMKGINDSLPHYEMRKEEWYKWMYRIANLYGAHGH